MCTFADLFSLSMSGYPLKKSSTNKMEAKSMHKWFADANCLQIMLMDSSLELKWMLLLLLFLFQRCPAQRLSLPALLGVQCLSKLQKMCRLMRSHFPFGFVFSHLSNIPSTSEPGPTKTKYPGPQRPA